MVGATRVQAARPWNRNAPDGGFESIRGDKLLGTVRPDSSTSNGRPPGDRVSSIGDRRGPILFAAWIRPPGLERCPHCDGANPPRVGSPGRCEWFGARRRVVATTGDGGRCGRFAARRLSVGSPPPFHSALPAARQPPQFAATVTTSSPTTITASSATATLPAPDARTAWTAVFAGHPGATSSPVGPLTTSAVVPEGRTAFAWRFMSGRSEQRGALELNIRADTARPVRVADLTGDREDDFLVFLDAPPCERGGGQRRRRSVAGRPFRRSVPKPHSQTPGLRVSQWSLGAAVPTPKMPGGRMVAPPPTPYRDGRASCGSSPGTTHRFRPVCCTAHPSEPDRPGRRR
jgi:hypothetical protein